MNMNCYVSHEDMVRGARSGSSSRRRLSNGRGSSMASTSSPSVPPPLALASDHSVPPPLAAGSGQFTPPPTVGASGPSVPPPLAVGPSASAPLVFLASASTVPEADDAVNLQEGGGSFYDVTLQESNHRFTRPSDEARSRLV
ncbi:hypothetical protein Taro_007150 [Colocasia esculenta]|uniref:Uncharacterized protein n=1 Tax=Colocasia esculenta TaxID=4460 RepID=A0A843TY50_COLES|nr:hypothetical protein [Colocasia esculenta]